MKHRILLPVISDPDFFDYPWDSFISVPKKAEMESEEE